MRKLGDILSILSSILLGNLIRETDILTESLQHLFQKQHLFYAPGIVSGLTSIFLVASFMRNIHGSVCYETFASKTNLKSSLDASVRGRMVVFFLALGALFLGPASAEHHLAHHPTSGGGFGFFTVLFLPFGVYYFWDLLLWLFPPDPENQEFERIVYRWVVIDGFILLFVLTFGIVSIYWKSVNRPFDYETTCLSFVVLAAATIVAVYSWNREFYFPA